MKLRTPKVEVARIFLDHILETREKLTGRVLQLRAELMVRTSYYGLPGVPESCRDQRAAYDAGYHTGWMNRQFKNPYTSNAHQHAYNAGYERGSQEAKSEINLALIQLTDEYEANVQKLKDEHNQKSEVKRKGK